jgi:hypothetical protein
VHALGVSTRDQSSNVVQMHSLFLTAIAVGVGESRHARKQSPKRLAEGNVWDAGRVALPGSKQPSDRYERVAFPDIFRVV